MQGLAALWAILAAMMAATPASSMQPHGQATVTVSTPAGTRTVTSPLQETAPGVYSSQASLETSSSGTVIAGGAGASAVVPSPAQLAGLWHLISSRF